MAWNVSGKPGNGRRGHVRIEPVHELPIFCLLLDEPQLKGHHDIHQSRQKRTFIRLDDLFVNLSKDVEINIKSIMSMSHVRGRAEHRVAEKVRTGRNGGEMILLIMGANSSCSISSPARCRNAPPCRVPAVLRHFVSDLYTSSLTFVRV